MTEATTALEDTVSDSPPVEEAVQSALRNYTKAIESAHSVLEPLRDQGTTTQSGLDQISGAIAVVEATQLALFSALRSVGRPVPATTHRI
jgi:hypothetical protein